MGFFQQANQGIDFLFNKLVRFFLPLDYFLKKENRNWKSFFQWYFISNAVFFLFIFQYPDFFEGEFLKNFYASLIVAIISPVFLYYYFNEKLGVISKLTNNSYFSTSKPKPKPSFSYLINSVIVAPFWFFSLYVLFWSLGILLSQFFIMDYFAVKIIGFSLLAILGAIFLAGLVIGIKTQIINFTALKAVSPIKKIIFSFGVSLFKVLFILVCCLLILSYYFILGKPIVDLIIGKV